MVEEYFSYHDWSSRHDARFKYYYLNSIGIRILGNIAFFLTRIKPIKLLIVFCTLIFMMLFKAYGINLISVISYISLTLLWYLSVIYVLKDNAKKDKFKISFLFSCIILAYCIIFIVCFNFKLININQASMSLIFIIHIAIMLLLAKVIYTAAASIVLFELKHNDFIKTFGYFVFLTFIPFNIIVLQKQINSFNKKIKK